MRGTQLPLKPELAQQRDYRDRVWGCVIKLEKCFEHPVAPPGSFLEWLLPEQRPVDVAGNEMQSRDQEVAPGLTRLEWSRCAEHRAKYSIAGA